MNIGELQKLVDDWIKEYGVRYFDERTNTILLSEEVGEFSRLIARKYGEQSFKKEISDSEIKTKISDELADIIFVLVCLANQMDINLEQAIGKNMQKKTSRDQDRHKQNKKLQ